jgi:hypothetical protein
MTAPRVAIPLATWLALPEVRGAIGNGYGANRLLSVRAWLRRHHLLHANEMVVPDEAIAAVAEWRRTFERHHQPPPKRRPRGAARPAS